ncbi:MAG TPA: Asp-tRNA(Asn)/Glu-tRNA(Gln) amidotransferase GatCAB subunit C, partial [Fervidobacterium sp.]|nr:Asp-tRNA(Asn)/Glu-tRNA(Gln) amidotransferase GatCAB subunit C [Fervidobacterium sp.]
NFPFLEWSDEEQRFVARHHPFTMPYIEDIENNVEPAKIRAYAYDMVMNGFEVGGGSIRIHKREIQEKSFEMIGLSKEEANEKFGFLLEALQYGVPPHGGIALGLDRLVSIAVGVENIREVIAFPKTSSGTCLLTSAPSTVSQSQLDEVGIMLKQ